MLGGARGEATSDNCITREETSDEYGADELLVDSKRNDDGVEAHVGGLDPLRVPLPHRCFVTPHSLLVGSYS